MTKEELESMFNGIVEHYNHACEKHPFFADILCVDHMDWKEMAEEEKMFIQQKVDREEAVASTTVFHAEMFEIFAAFCSGNYEQARYEVLDAIAVLLRMDDMIRDAQERKEKKNDV